MPNTDMEAIRKDLEEINGFVRERIDPVSSRMGLLSEEVERLGREVVDIQQRDRTRRRDVLARLVEQTPGHHVQEGAYAGMDILDLALVSRFARSQRRESFGPAWVERAEDAKRGLVRGITAADVQASHHEAARRLESWFTVDSKPTGQYEGFGRALLQSMTRAALDSTTAGYGDELVATLEARELWLDVNLQTLVAPLVPTFPMPSNPFDVPTQLGDVSFYPGTENVAAADTRLGTGKTTLTAHELVGQAPYSFTLEEDGVVAMLPEIRAGSGAQRRGDSRRHHSQRRHHHAEQHQRRRGRPSPPPAQARRSGSSATTESCTCRSSTTRARPTTTGQPSPTTCSTSCAPSWANTESGRPSSPG